MHRNQIEEGLVLLKKATSGEWKVRELPGNPDDFFVQAPRSDLTHPYDIEVLGDDVTLYSTRRADANLIVWLKNNAEFLINAAASYQGHVDG